MPGKECFVGITMDDDDRHMVTEAGANCERNHQPQKYGMTLMRQSKCPAKHVPKNRIPITPRPPAINSRPVSPRLSTVRSVIVDGVEQLLEKAEEKVEQSYFESEFESTSTPRPRIHKHNKHANKHGHGHHEEDILTNGIPGSSGSRTGYSSASSDQKQISVWLLLCFWLLAAIH